MPKSRREQKKERREAKRKDKRRVSHGQVAPRSIRSMLHNALNWPVMECWANKDWVDPQKLNQVVVARRDPRTGEVIAGLYLVDRACLGIKNAHAANFADAHQFRKELLAHVRQTQEMIKIDFDLAAALVKAGLDYGDQLGFRPHRDFRNASILLQDAHPDAVTVDIAVGGEDGRPFFMSGPYDNVERIMSHLTRRLGPGGFTYMIGLDPDSEFYRIDEDFEVIEDDDDDDDDFIDIQPADDV